MTKSLNELLAIKDISEFSTDELAALATDIEDAEEREELEYVRNNAVANDLLDTMFSRGDLKPYDAVDIAMMMIVKMVIGNAANDHKAAEMIAGVIGRIVSLTAKNTHQINSTKADTYRTHGMKDGKIQKRKDLQ